MVLAKQDFKFSAAHFTLFPDAEPERLHGHNYRVALEVSGTALDGDGLLIDFADLKAAVRAECARLDGRVLLPERSPRLRMARAGDSLEVACGARAYRFPAADVVLLPAANSSVELLARLLWESLAPRLAGAPVDRLAVTVEETDGQSCVYEAPLG